MKKSRTIFLVIVIVVAVVAIAVAIMALRVHPKKSAVTSYDSCVASKGSTILTTYPEQCVTSDGQHFTKTQ